MSKRFLITVGALLVGGGLFWVAVRWYAERQATLPPTTDQELARGFARVHGAEPIEPALVLERPLDPSRMVRLAISSLGLPDDSQNHQLAYVLTAESTGARGLLRDQIPHCCEL